MVYTIFFFRFSIIITAVLSVGSVSIECYTLKNPFKYSFMLYLRAYLVLSYASSGNNTTMLLNAVIDTYVEPYYHSFCSLSHLMFLSSSGSY